MPYLHQSDSELPSWCELRSYEIIHLPTDSSRTLSADAPKQKLIICEGHCHATFADQAIVATPGTNLDVGKPRDTFVIDDVSEETIVVHMAGDWGEERGGSGLFTVTASDDPQDEGDPVPYPKQTNFDAHFHDCDEYWIIYRGSGVAVSEGKHYEVGPGDCIATGMGHHHDFPLVHEPIHAVYFETTLAGQKRRGHLWEHTHGLASPQRV